jgi:hypothetical protein
LDSSRSRIVARRVRDDQRRLGDGVPHLGLVSFTGSPNGWYLVHSALSRLPSPFPGSGGAGFRGRGCAHAASDHSSRSRAPGHLTGLRSRQPVAHGLREPVWIALACIQRATIRSRQSRSGPLPLASADQASAAPDQDLSDGRDRVALSGIPRNTAQRQDAAGRSPASGGSGRE